MKKRIVVLAIIALLVLVLTGCAPQLASIDVIDRDIKMNKGESQVIEVVKTYTTQEVTVDQAVAAIEKADFEWVSSDASVVTVDGGRVTAVCAGEAVITVTARCGKTPVSIDVRITVVVPATNIDGLPENLELVINSDEDTIQLAPIVLPADSTDFDLAYRSEDEAVVTVDETGLVTAVGDGETEIVVSCGAVEMRIAVNVTTYTTPKATSASRRTSSGSSTGSSSGGSSSGSSTPSTPSPAPSTPAPAPSAPAYMPSPSDTGDGYFLDPAGISPDDGGF